MSSLSFCVLVVECKALVYVNLQSTKGSLRPSAVRADGSLAWCQFYQVMGASNTYFLPNHNVPSRKRRWCAAICHQQKGHDKEVVSWRKKKKDFMLLVVTVNPYILLLACCERISLTMVATTASFAALAAAWAVLFVSSTCSVQGFTRAPWLRPRPRSFTAQQPLFVSSTMTLEASFGNDYSLSKAAELAGNILPAESLLGHYQQQQQQAPITATTSSSSSSSSTSLREELEKEQQHVSQRKTKISASVKETGYDSINTYMVRVCRQCGWFHGGTNGKKNDLPTKVSKFSCTLLHLSLGAQNRNPCAITNS